MRTSTVHPYTTACHSLCHRVLPRVSCLSVLKSKETCHWSVVEEMHQKGKVSQSCQEAVLRMVSLMCVYIPSPGRSFSQVTHNFLIFLRFIVISSLKPFWFINYLNQTLLTGLIKMMTSLHFLTSQFKPPTQTLTESSHIAPEFWFFCNFWMGQNKLGFNWSFKTLFLQVFHFHYPPDCCFPQSFTVIHLSPPILWRQREIIIKLSDENFTICLLLK